MTNKQTIDKKNIKDRITVAKSDDGTVQINFDIPWEDIVKNREAAVKEIAETIEIPGFRKGKAPLDKVIEKVPQNNILERVLNKVLPKLLSEAIETNDLKLTIYPKFEIVSAKDNENWQVRAISCEIPEVTLGDYKKIVTGALRSKTIWTPDKKEEAKPTKEDKEAIVINALTENIKVKLPKILIDEEVNARLSRLLERIDKLGLSLDSYLASLGKTAESLREEYEKEAVGALSLDLILSKVAVTENFTVSEDEVKKAIEASNFDSSMEKDFETKERKRVVEAVLKKRKALDYLTNLS